MWTSSSAPFLHCIFVQNPSVSSVEMTKHNILASASSKHNWCLGYKCNFGCPYAHFMGVGKRSLL